MTEQRFLHLTSGLDVVVDRDPYGGYFALVPAIPGCGSQGDSIRETLENVDDALMTVLEVMRQDDPDRMLQLCGHSTPVEPWAESQETTTGGSWYGHPLEQVA